MDKKYPTPDSRYVNFYESVWLCNHANNVSYQLQARTRNMKLRTEYIELTGLVRAFIKSQIGPHETADAYIRAELDMHGPVTEQVLEFRHKLLNDMIECAEAEEQSHQQ